MIFMVVKHSLLELHNDNDCRKFSLWLPDGGIRQVRCLMDLIEFSLYITQDFTRNHAYMISIVLNFTFLSEKLSKLPRGQVTQIQTELWPDLSAPEGPR